MKSNPIQNIKNDISQNISSFYKEKATQSCLEIKPANQWIEEAKNKPIPKMLFSEFWYENEVCILFADTNLGKSILAVQIAESISRGVAIPNFKIESKPQKVLYLDFELSEKQFEKRSSKNYEEHYEFSSNFDRAQFNSLYELPKGVSLEEHLCDSLFDIVHETDTKVLIVDNLTFLSNENEKAKDALTLMKSLKKISIENNASILVLSHTPKRDNSKPITKNDLSGSKMLMNFCDSSFAIGESSKDSSLRYIKQIKQRNTEHIYDAENVVVCSINRIKNLLGFVYIQNDSEYFHLKSYEQSDKEEINNSIIELIEEGVTNVQIGKRLGLSEGAIRKRRKALNL